MEALAAGNAIRLRRAALKRDIVAGRTSVQTVLREPIPDWLECMSIGALLDAKPRLFKSKITQLVAEVGATETTRLLGLGIRQRALLIHRLNEYDAARRRDASRRRRQRGAEVVRRTLGAEA